MIPDKDGCQDKCYVCSRDFRACSTNDVKEHYEGHVKAASESHMEQVQEIVHSLNETQRIIIRSYENHFTGFTPPELTINFQLRVIENWIQ